MEHVLDNLPREVAHAVQHFWRTRVDQQRRQAAAGKVDQGTRSAVTGGRQMDGFVDLMVRLIVEAGMPQARIFRRASVERALGRAGHKQGTRGRRQGGLELPGFFRPTKEWDLLVVVDGQLFVVMELKSQVGPSFGNNFNNRCEEAIGSAVDLWTAYREGALGSSSGLWLGYLMLLEDCEKSRAAVNVMEPHFPVFEEFRNASYMKRYELLCRRLVRERHYAAAALVVSQARMGLDGKFTEPAEDIGLTRLARSLAAHVGAYRSQ